MLGGAERERERERELLRSMLDERNSYLCEASWGGGGGAVGGGGGGGGVCVWLTTEGNLDYWDRGKETPWKLIIPRH